MSDFVQGLDGDLYVQTQRSENFSHLTCVNVADLPLPQGDLTTVYCPDDARKGHVKAAGQIRGEPAAGTTTITRPLSTVVNWLLENTCGFEAFIAWACQGSRAIPENYEVGAVLFDVQPTNTSVLSAVARNRGQDAQVDVSAEVSYTDRKMVYHLEVAAVEMTNTSPANGIAFLPEACETKCAAARDGCAEGYMGLDGTLYDSEVKKSDDGVTWTQTVADPFAEGGDAGDFIIFEMWDGHRAVVARISTSTHLPAEISYTEDSGATWTNVSVGAVVGQTVNAMWTVGGALYVACSGGDIYQSLDLADTWTRVATGITAESLNDIVFYSTEAGYAVGDSNVFMYTNNGTTWFLGTGPAAGVNLLCVAVNDKGHIFVGAADGNLYVSENGGTTWETRRSFGTGTIDWIGFDQDTLYFGGLIFNTPDPLGTFYRSINGGATWVAPTGQTGTWNSGLNAAHICDQNNFFLVGELHDGTTLAAKVQPA